jgi:hypothetical protein
VAKAKKQGAAQIGKSQTFVFIPSVANGFTGRAQKLPASVHLTENAHPVKH